MRFPREVHQLENGIRVVLEKRQSAIPVGICCSVGAGSRNDYARKDGLAHYIEHLLFRSRLHDETRSLFEQFSDAGGDMNAVTMLDRTSFSLQSLSEDVGLGIQVLARIVGDLPSSESDLKSERAIILDEMLLTGEDSAQAFQRVKFKLLGGDESLRHSATGKRRRLGKISTDDVRQFYNEFYRTENMAIGIVGDIDTDAVLGMLNKEFARIASGTAQSEHRALEAIGPRIKHVPSATSQEGYVSCFFRCPSLRSNQLAALQVVTDVIVGGPHSRLFQRLREKDSLVYDVSGSLELTPEFGTLDIFVPTKRSNVHRVLQAVLDEIEKLKRDSLSDEALARWRTSLMKRGLLGFDDVMVAACWYAETELLASGHNADDFEGWNAKLQQVDKKAFDEVVHDVFSPENSFLYAIGNLAPWHRRKINRRLKAL
jgi:predicted Zn-dependent peptidase